MGFFDFLGDIVHVVTQPITSVFDAVSDVAQGKNVFDSARDLVSKEITGVALAPLAVATDIPGVKQGLNAISPFTLGVTGDLVKAGTLENTLAKEDRAASWTELRDTAVTGVKDGLIVGAGVLTGGAIAGAGGGTVATLEGVTGGLAGAGTASKLLSGDVGGAIQGAAGIAGADGVLPEGFSDTVNSVKDTASAAEGYAQQAEDLYNRFLAGKSSIPPYQSGYSSNQSGYQSGQAAQAVAGVGVPLILIAGVSYFLLKGRH